MSSLALPLTRTSFFPQPEISRPVLKTWEARCLSRTMTSGEPCHVRYHQMPDIKIKRVYDTPDPHDGVRILVDRLWPRGLHKSDVHMEYWLKDVAPSPELRRWFGHDPANWNMFQIRYRQELMHGNADLSRLIHLAGQQNVTLLYAAHNTQCNHALILQDFLRKTVAKQKMHG